jgi:hypothetical protein
MISHFRPALVALALLGATPAHAATVAAIAQVDYSAVIRFNGGDAAIHNRNREMTRVDDLRVGFDSHIRLCGRLDALGVTGVACNGWRARRKNGASGQRIGTEILVFSDGSVAAFARNSGGRKGANVDQIETLREAWLRAKTQGAGSHSI